METLELRVEGMSCGHCVRAVTTALEGVPGVSSARVDLEARRAEVEHAGADALALVAAVAEAGYGAEIASSGQPGPGNR